MTDYTPAFKPGLFKILGCTLSVQAPNGTEFAVVFDKESDFPIIGESTEISAPRLKEERDELLDGLKECEEALIQILSYPGETGPATAAWHKAQAIREKIK